MKKAKFWNVYPDFLTRKLNRNNQKCLFVFKNKINDTILKIITNFSKIDENLGKNSGKCE